MLFYTDRSRLERKYIQWADKNNIEISPETVIAYLVVHNLINETLALNFINSPKKDCRDCKYFLGCECFSGTPCNGFKEKDESITVNATDV